MSEARRMLHIDGSQGEGGGQILRTSLALSMITGTPIRIDKIRARRSKPGLMRQHLTSVLAAARVSGAHVQGAEVGSREISFTPSGIQPGVYHFAVGTAGSTTLILQTVLPALLLASRPYPAGGGRLEAVIHPSGGLSSLDLLERWTCGTIRGPMDSFLVCPSCRVPLSSEEDALVCRSCGTRYPVDDGIADFSGGRYYDGFVPGQELSAAHLEGLSRENEGARSRIADFYLPLFERSVSGRRVLDCGCGNGMSVDLLSAAGWEAWGNDLSALRKWQWRERERRDRLIVADGGRLPFASGSFDAVVSSGVLEHIGVGEVGGEQYKVWPLPDRDAQRRAFVAELLRVTAPGGRLFLDFPNGAFPIDFWHGTRPGGARFHPRDEGFLPTVSEVRELLAALDPDLSLTPLSPRGRLQFRQAGGHWYGKALKAPMSLAFRLMTVPGFRFLAGTPLNPFLVLEVRREG